MFFYSCVTTWQGKIHWHSQRSASKLQSTCLKRCLGKLKWKYMQGMHRVQNINFNALHRFQWLEIFVFCRRNSLGRWIFEIGNQKCYWCLRRQKPLSCLNPMLLEADLNLLVLQRRNLLMFYALLPLLLTVPRWMLDFPANGVNPRNLNLVASFPLVGDPRKTCKVLWDTFQFLSRKSSAGMLACGHFLAPFASSFHVH